MTDPSYKGQFVCFTHPHIGNTGINFGGLRVLAGLPARRRSRPALLPALLARRQRRQAAQQQQLGAGQPGERACRCCGVQGLAGPRVEVTPFAPRRAAEDTESEQCHLGAIVVRDLSCVVSNYRSQKSLQQYCEEQNVIGISNVDTRQLTKLLRNTGCLVGVICRDASKSDAELLEMTRGWTIVGKDLLSVVSCTEPYEWKDPTRSEWEFNSKAKAAQAASPFLVVAYDFGIKHNILRRLAAFGCKIIVVPATYPAAEVLKMAPDGVFFSNGPGDPSAAPYAVENARQIIGKKPTFGICMGHQLMGQAFGGERPRRRRAGQALAQGPGGDCWAPAACCLPATSSLLPAPPHLNARRGLCWRRPLRCTPHARHTQRAAAAAPAVVEAAHFPPRLPPQARPSSSSLATTAATTPSATTPPAASRSPRRTTTLRWTRTRCLPVSGGAAAGAALPAALPA
jgi:hypothetical protein